jgi:malonyl-CoA O-methyltransferase
MMSLRAKDIRRRFDRAATHFDEFDFVHAVTRDGLFARLEPMLVDAKSIIDLGCATGTACKALAKRYRGAQIIGVDQSANMLQRANRKKPWLAKYSFLEASADAIPLADQSVDLVFCNQLLPWVDDAPLVFAEVNRLLRKGGLFIFASLGPDSFSALRRAWQASDHGVHVNNFPDMHDLGDAAVRAGLSDPVLDVDRLTVTYENTAALFRDLTGSAARNCLANRALFLTGKDRFAAMSRELQTPGSSATIELELELVYGHCWGSGPRARAGEVRIDPGRIGRRA